MQGFWLLFKPNANYNLNSCSFMKPVIYYSCMQIMGIIFGLLVLNEMHPTCAFEMLVWP